MSKTAEYTRVLPRDLFNEAKLLKCMGRLCLLIEDGMTPVPMEIEYFGEPFDIQLLEDGYLFISNIHISTKNEYLFFKTSYNSKSNYPLLMDFENYEIEVFDDEGNFSEEFIKAVS